MGEALTVEDGVAAIKAHRVLELLLPLRRILILDWGTSYQPERLKQTKELTHTLESAIQRYACMSVAGPRYSS